jgi:hypothetical protein
LCDLEELHFEGMFDQPLERTLQFLWNLKILKIGIDYDLDSECDCEKEQRKYCYICFDNGGQTLSFDSFNNCKSLKTIRFPDKFKKKLSNSLLNDFKNHGINIDFYYCDWLFFL